MCGYMSDNIDRMVLSNDQQYLYDICLSRSRGECYSDMALRKPGPVAHSRLLKRYSSDEWLGQPPLMDRHSPIMETNPGGLWDGQWCESWQEPSVELKLFFVSCLVVISK
ncbi:hypothetical protein AVEN_157962-1, partial [Araneus ventricosus]